MLLIKLWLQCQEVQWLCLSNVHLLCEAVCVIPSLGNLTEYSPVQVWFDFLPVHKYQSMLKIYLLTL
jgi:hypothetical protein